MSWNSTSLLFGTYDQPFHKENLVKDFAWVLLTSPVSNDKRPLPNPAPWQVYGEKKIKTDINMNMMDTSFCFRFFISMIFIFMLVTRWSPIYDLIHNQA